MQYNEFMDQMDRLMTGVSNTLKQIRESDHPALPDAQSKQGMMQLVISATPIIAASYIKEYIESGGASSSIIMATTMPGA